MLNNCLQMNVPVLMIAGNGQSCGHCIDFRDRVLVKQKFLNWLKSVNNNFIIIDVVHSSSYVTGGYKALEKKIGEELRGTFPFVVAFWQNGKKKNVLNRRGDDYTDPGTFINAIQKISNGYQPPKKIVEVISADIYGTGCFGLYHDVTLYAKDG